VGGEERGFIIKISEKSGVKKNIIIGLLGVGKKSWAPCILESKKREATY